MIQIALLTCYGVNICCLPSLAAATGPELLLVVLLSRKDPVRSLLLASTVGRPPFLFSPDPSSTEARLIRSLSEGWSVAGLNLRCLPGSRHSAASLWL
ncbi:hypothetical protein V8C26DRAFT_341606 [Trichoderma gracile]